MQKKGEGKLSLAEIQSASFHVLEIISQICEKENLRYYLAYGTLLGAVRHEGFIPWDDDVDIMMPQPDYERFLTYFMQHAEDLNPYRLMNDNTTENYPYLISRICDTRYTLNVINEKPYGIGVFVDIYPLYGIGNDMGEARKIIDKGKNLSSLIFLSTRKHFHKGNTKTFLKVVIKIPAFFYAKIKGKKFFSEKSWALINKYNYDDSRYVGCIIWPTYRYRDIYERDVFEKHVYAKFEGGEFRIPGKFKSILSQIYGDYMKLPPKSEQVAHHLYSAYKKEV